MAPSRALLVAALALAVAVSAGCGRDPAAAGAVVPPPRLEDVQRAVLMGTGQVCDDDRGCGVGANPLARGACVLGTCFGLLTTDAPAARATLVDRLAAMPADVQDAVVTRLDAHLWRPTAMPSVRVACAAGLAAIAEARGCGAACDVLQRLESEPDDALAAEARLGRCRAGLAAACAAAVTDLKQGSEHLRAAAARALGVGMRKTRDPDVTVALQAALQDRSPVVRRVAAEALVAFRDDAAIAASLEHARRQHPADLGYVVDRGVGAQEPMP